MRKPSIWKHPSKKNNAYTGSYEYAKKDRVFQLTRKSKNGTAWKTYESWQEAVKRGWEKIR